MGSIFFASHPVSDFRSAEKGNAGLFKRYYISMLNQGIYLAPSPFETTFLSLAHGEEAIQKTIDAAAHAFHDIKTSSL